MAEVAEVMLWEEDRAMPPDELRSWIPTADGLFCMLTDRVDRQLLEAAPRLRVISQMAVGVDNIDLAACRALRIPVGHTPDVLTETTADTAFALLAASVRRIVEGVDYVRAGRWQRWEPDLLLGGDLHGTTIGIVGLGRIGQAVARRAAGFGMKILYTARAERPPAAVLGAEFRSLPGLLAESDHVILTVALTPDTHHLIDRRALAQMRPSATLVNVSRGAIIDQAALAEALGAGVIAAAALDVTDPEPIDPDDPLLRMERCIVIPHLGSASLGTRRAMAELAVANLLAGLAGRPLPHQAG